MTARSKSMLRGGVRATVGILVIGAVAVGGYTLENSTLPDYEREPIAVTVDTLHGAEQVLVCTGSFSELGADVSRPSVVIPTGTPTTVQSGDVRSEFELDRSEPGGSLPKVVTGQASDALAAAQLQRLNTETLRGVSATGCYEPAHEQWLLGGSTTLGAFTTLSLGNPSGVPATVQITLFDEAGKVDQASTSSVLVPPRSERTVSLNGYAPARASLAVQVVSSGAAVTASLGISEVAALDPYAVDTVARQLSAEATLTFAGITNISSHEVGGPGDAGDLDNYPVVVRAFPPGGETGSANVYAVFGDGSRETVTSFTFSGDAVVDTPIAHWPEDARALVVEADAPLLGAVFASFDDEETVVHDYAWFAPSPVLAADTPVAAAVVPDAQLVLVNPSANEVTVVVTDGAGEVDSREVKLPAGGAAVVNAPPSALLEADGPFHAGVRVTTGGIAGYPVVLAADRARTLTVYTR